MNKVLVSPVAIVAPADADPQELQALARFASREQRAAVVLHRTAMPWLALDLVCDGHMMPQAEVLIDMVARRAGGQLWALLRTGESRNGGWPMWLAPWVRRWEKHHRMPSRIRSGDPAAWAHALGGLDG